MPFVTRLGALRGEQKHDSDDDDDDDDDDDRFLRTPTTG